LAEGTFDSYREDFIGNYQPTSKVLEGRANSRLPKQGFYKAEGK
jgi:hypothetical protein